MSFFFRIVSWDGITYEILCKKIKKNIGINPSEILRKTPQDQLKTFQEELSRQKFWEQILEELLKKLKKELLKPRREIPGGATSKIQRGNPREISGRNL